MSNIVFTDEQVLFCGPPPANSKKPPRTKWQRIAEAVKTQPGEWAYLGLQPIQTAWRINKGLFPAMRNGSWQAVARRSGYHRKQEVWVRYLGDFDSAAAFLNVEEVAA